LFTDNKYDVYDIAFGKYEYNSPCVNITIQMCLKCLNLMYTIWITIWLSNFITQKNQIILEMGRTQTFVPELELNFLIVNLKFG